MWHLKQSLLELHNTIPVLLQQFFMLSLGLHIFCIVIFMYNGMHQKIIKLDLATLPQSQSFYVVHSDQKKVVTVGNSSSLASRKSPVSKVALAQNISSKKISTKKKIAPKALSTEKKIISKKTSKPNVPKKNSSIPAKSDNATAKTVVSKKKVIVSQPEKKIDLAALKKESKEVKKIASQAPVVAELSDEVVPSPAQVTEAKNLATEDLKEDFLAFDININTDSHYAELVTDVQNSLRAVWQGPLQRPLGSRCKMRVVINRQGIVENIEELDASSSIAYNIAVYNALTKSNFPRSLWGITCELLL